MMFLNEMKTDQNPASFIKIINALRRKINKQKLKIKNQKRYIAILHARLSEFTPKDDEIK